MPGYSRCYADRHADGLLRPPDAPADDPDAAAVRRIPHAVPDTDLFAGGRGRGEPADAGGASDGEALHRQRHRGTAGGKGPGAPPDQRKRRPVPYPRADRQRVAVLRPVLLHRRSGKHAGGAGAFRGGKDTLRRLLLRVADNLSETQEDTE